MKIVLPCIGIAAADHSEIGRFTPIGRVCRLEIDGQRVRFENHASVFGDKTQRPNVRPSRPVGDGRSLD